MAAPGPSRLFAATQQLGRVQSEADMGRDMSEIASVVNDLNRSRRAGFAESHYLECPGEA
jgi:hypothetical protein